MILRLVLILIGYLFGLIQTGYFYGKLKGKDLTKAGSGNTGATNALRVYGWKGAVIVYLVDMLKMLIPCVVLRVCIAKSLLPNFFLNEAVTMWPLVAMFYLAFGCILGNDFPFFRHFKGGKGIAAASGLLLAWHPVIFLIGILIFILITKLTGYVSLASVLLCLLLIVESFVYGKIFFNDAWMTGHAWEFYVLAIFIAGIIIFRHKDNIQRLLNGTENRFGKHKKA